MALEEQSPEKKGPGKGTIILATVVVVIGFGGGPLFDLLVAKKEIKKEPVTNSALPEESTPKSVTGFDEEEKAKQDISDPFATENDPFGDTDAIPTIKAESGVLAGVRDSVAAFNELDTKISTQQEQINALSQSINSVDERLTSIDQKLDGVVDYIDQKVEEAVQKPQGDSEEVIKLRDQVAMLDRKIQDLQLLGTLNNQNAGVELDGGSDQNEFFLEDPDFVKSEEAATPEVPPAYVKIPAGSKIKVKLLRGAFVPTQLGSSNNREVVLAFIALGNFYGANNTVIPFNKAVFLARMTGDIADRRVYGEVFKCVMVLDDEDNTVIDVPVDGAIDEKKGTAGIPGHYEYQKGALVKSAMWRTFMGAAGYLVDKNTVTSTSLDSGFTSTSTADGGNELQGALGKALLEGLERPASFYDKEADAIYPTLEVKPGEDAWLFLKDTAEITGLEKKKLIGAKHDKTLW